MKLNAKRFISLIITGMLVACMAVPATSFAAQTASVKVVGKYLHAYSSAVLGIVNKQRSSAGADALMLDKSLQSAAQIRAREVAMYFSHERPDGTQCFTVSSAAYGENIAAGYKLPADVMNGWMNSEGHRNNILNAKYKTIGIGSFTSNGVTSWVQLFGLGGSEAKLPDKNDTQDASYSVTALTSRFNYRVVAASKYKSGDTKLLSVLQTNANPDWPVATAKLDNSSFKWSSSNAKALTVDSLGALTAIEDGSAVVTCALKTNTSVKASVKVAVTGKKVIRPKAVKTIPKIYIVKGKTAALPWAVSPTDAKNKTVTWSSTDSKTVSVSKNGVIKGLKPGKANITVTTNDGQKKSNCTVYVVAKAVNLKSLTIPKVSAKACKAGKAIQLAAKISPANTTGAVAVWKSSAPKVASVDKLGLLTMHKAGKTTISAKTGGKTAKLVIEVN